jgi:hypothetical protein
MATSASAGAARDISLIAERSAASAEDPQGR